MPDDLIASARMVREHAYAPYSGYKVGAAIRDENGAIWAGANVENVSYGATICAERAAVTAMVSSGARIIQALSVVTADSGAPCGICLQVLREFTDDPAGLKILLVDGGGSISETTLAELLPRGFASTEVPRTESPSQ